MPDFYPTAMTDEAFVRGPARILYASMSTAFPTQIADVINLSTFVANASWTDVGATKGGVTVSFNNSEETFDIDQILTDILTLPSGSELSVATALGQATLDWLSFAWEGDAVSTNAAPPVPEKQMGLGPFDSYTQRRLCVAFRRPTTGKIRMGAFRRTVRMPVESNMVFNKTGDQQSFAMTWRCLPDTSVASVRSRFATFFDQQ